MLAVQNFLLIVAEIGLLLVIFGVINWLAGEILKQLTKAVSSKKIRITIQNIEKNIQTVLTLSAGLLGILILGFNSWLIYQGENLLEYTKSFINSIPKEFWENLGMGVGRSLFLLLLVAITQPYIQRLIDNLSDRTKKFQYITANDESIESFFNFLSLNLINIIWLLSLTLCTQFIQLPEVIPQYMYIALRIYIIIAVGILLVKANIIIIDTLDALSEKYSSPNKLLRLYDSLRHLIPLSKRCLEYVIYLSMASLVFQQLEFIAYLATIGPKVIQIVGIFYTSRVIEEIGKLLARKFLLGDDKELDEIDRKRRETLLPLFESTLKYLTYVGAIIAILNVLNIDSTPVLASAGILGLGISMGAQSIVEDLVAGLFNLFEGYYLVGDFVEIDDIKGYVTAIELKTTRIRFEDKDYIIRNGEIGSIVNHSRYSEAVVTVNVAYNANLEHVYKVIEAVGEKLKQDNEDVLEATEVNGVEKFDRYQLVIQTTTQVKPGTNEDIEMYLRKMIVDAFEEAGIEIPHRGDRKSKKSLEDQDLEDKEEEEEEDEEDEEDEEEKEDQEDEEDEEDE
ncbi:MAG: mechanosensitive ion channel family protein [Okeania sp. SIO2C9]|uniref:mechanosensitive ion channel family protein n=1 Tax=Okeania sp. SIO2C9 TaxID=2607791 RepID=UPI0013BFE7B2|nr:mechanosensitive ion channel domain-containing protein [Okeania sp. SIO2C9]NEQ74245.1 mechanosensitive ion channel family protein [Okeania sp. SIO2C9]